MKALLFIVVVLFILAVSPFALMFVDYLRHGQKGSGS